ncbi:MULTISPECIES: histidine phosphatase family protein [Pseudonocardia]|uniref:histidine phosphatase family protein n=1 Tax=Pseudonocardia TaxID=1847 RepID=UPI0018D519F3|nr:MULTISPECIES: histidine phosphatase family protein [Pseudonocardia]
MTFVVQVATKATQGAEFPAGGPVDDRMEPRLRRLTRLRADRVRHAPEPASVATCAAVGRGGAVDAELRGWDAGRWAGRALDAVAVEDPAGVAQWLADPGAAPHGGESLLDLLDRVTSWLGAARPGHTLAVCGPAVVRAATVVVLGAPPAAFWRIDAAPLTSTDLRGGPGRWTVRATGVRLARTETAGTRHAMPRRSRPR